MHLTPRATRLAISLSLTLSLGRMYGLESKVPQLLDLTKQRASEIHSMGVPGNSAGGWIGELKNAGYELPIRIGVKELRIEDAFMTLELEVTNLGDVSISVPSCLDGHEAFQMGATDRRSMEFGLLIESPTANGHTTAETIQATFGSSRPECSTHLEASSTLMIVMKVRAPGELLGPHARVTIGSARIFVDEVEFDDDRYYVKSRSKRVESLPIKIFPM
jgi:hypothetical protein